MLTRARPLPASATLPLPGRYQLIVATNGALSIRNLHPFGQALRRASRTTVVTRRRNG
ncbi:MAG TPA: hypothetical protein VHE78_15900 [Gemmatimonadaceae bacterium]|nr:hypothetical protein [Gemmatimonadaceae bacterium]